MSSESRVRSSETVESFLSSEDVFNFSELNGSLLSPNSLLRAPN